VPISLLLIRHARHRDVGLRLTGRGPEQGLTETGRAEAEATAGLLRGEPMAAIYASPRVRTQETARIMADGRGIALRTDSALDEIDFGEWTGRSFDDLAGDPRWDRWNGHRSTARCPGGESMADAQERAVAFVQALTTQHDGEQVAIVSHCDIIRALLCWNEERSLDTVLQVEVEPASVHRIVLAAPVRAAA
jgi:probable phosphoglycerate mutase